MLYNRLKCGFNYSNFGKFYLYSLKLKNVLKELEKLNIQVFREMKTKFTYFEDPKTCDFILTVSNINLTIRFAYKFFHQTNSHEWVGFLFIFFTRDIFFLAKNLSYDHRSDNKKTNCLNFFILVHNADLIA